MLNRPALLFEARTLSPFNIVMGKVIISSIDSASYYGAVWL